jgi:hypothetical protein
MTPNQTAYGVPTAHSAKIEHSDLLAMMPINIQPNPAKPGC